MKIELREDRPPVPAADLAAAERELAELGRRIPESYKALLADQDGGRPVRDEFAFQEGDHASRGRVRLFFGVGEQPDRRLVDIAGLWMGLPDGMLAIGADDFGNLVCLREDGPVVSLDHEEFDEDEPDAGGIHPIAPTSRRSSSCCTRIPTRPGLRSRLRAGCCAACSATGELRRRRPAGPRAAVDARRRRGVRPGGRRAGP